MATVYFGDESAVIGVGDALEFTLPDGKVIRATVAEDYGLREREGGPSRSMLVFGFVKAVRNITRGWNRTAEMLPKRQAKSQIRFNKMVPPGAV